MAPRRRDRRCVPRSRSCALTIPARVPKPVSDELDPAAAPPGGRPACRIPRRILPGRYGQARRPPPRYGPADRRCAVSSRGAPPTAGSPASRSRNHTRRRLNTNDVIRPISRVTAKTNAQTCAGSKEVCSDTHSLKPVKVIWVPSSRVTDSPTIRFSRACLMSRPLSTWAVSMEKTDCDRPPSIPRSPR